LIETEQQRRWWFATHPEFSRNNAEDKRKFRDDEGARPTPEPPDAWVDRLLAQARDDFWIAVLRDIQAEYAAETAAKKQALLIAQQSADAGTSDTRATSWGESLQDLMEAIREVFDPSRAKELIWGTLKPTGRGYYLKTESLEKTEVIARGREIREVRELVRKYGGRPQDWIKWKGEGQVMSPSGVSRPAEIHWYEHHGIGKRKAKWIRWLD